MTPRISKGIADAMKEHDRPLEIEDASGQVYFLLTKQKYRRYVYDDSDLTSDEMIAAAAFGLNDLCNDQQQCSLGR